MERAGSIVKDLREALQDVVAPDLRAVVRGLADLKEQMQESNKLLREELAAVERRTAERIKLSEQNTADRIEASELRTNERIARVYDKIENVDLKRRLEQVTREKDQLISRAEQKH